MNWDVLVDRNDLRRAEIRPAPEKATLGRGEVELEVERFSLTANNITYGLIGDAFGYWKFFPAPEGLGRIPVWGFARVVRSEADDVPVGLRLFGYLPMSTRFVMQLRKARSGYVDAAAHRAELPPTYNAYAEAPEDGLDDHRALLRPLFMTSWLLDDALGEQADLKTLVLSSASSKTAMGLAWLARSRGLQVIGLSSPANAEKLGGLGLYDRVVTYDQAGGLAVDGPAAYVDFAGDRAVTKAVHEALGDTLVRSLIVGATHWTAGRDALAIPGVEPVLFFAPDQIRKRIQEWGQAELDARFIEALLAAYHDVLEGRARPDEGHIIRPA